MAVAISAVLVPVGLSPAQAQEGSELTGTVKAQTGESVGGAVATLCSVEPNHGGADGHHGVLWGTVESDRTGTFSFTDVPDGQYALNVADPMSVGVGGDPTRYLQGRWLGGDDTGSVGTCGSWPDDPQVVEVDGADVADLDLALPVGGRVAGLTTDRAGHPISQVYFSHPRFSGRGLGAGYSGPDDSDGYRTVLMKPGRRTLTFEAGVGAEAIEKSVTVTVRAGSTTNRDVGMPLAGNTIRSGWGGIDAPRVLRPGAMVAPHPLAWWHQATEVGYQWMRDGDRIPGATHPGYQLTAADAGHDLSLRVTGRLDGLPAQRYRSEPVPIPDVIVDLQLRPNVAPSGHPERIWAKAEVDAVNGPMPEGTVKIWDPLGIQEDRGYQPYLVGAGTVGDDGLVQIDFDQDLYLELSPYYGPKPSSEVWAEFIPDDPDVTGGRSLSQQYRLTTS